MDTDAEGSRQEGDKSRYNLPIFMGEEGKVTQAPEGEQVKHKVILEYSSDEVSESQLDQIYQEYPTVADVDRIKKVKKNIKLTIPRHPTVEGLTDSFIAWYKDHGMTTMGGSKASLIVKQRRGSQVWLRLYTTSGS